MKNKVHITPSYRQLTASKTGKPFVLQECYIWIDGCPYPQKFNQFADSPMAAGVFEVPSVLSVQNDRIDFRLDFNSRVAIEK